MHKQVLLVAGLALLAGCTKDKSNPRADFTGQVQLVDEFGNSQGAGGDVQVTATDISVRNGNQRTSQTTSTGSYSAYASGTSTHELSFSKPGYAPTKSTLLLPDASQPVAVPAVTLAPVSTTKATILLIQQVAPWPRTKYVVYGSVSPLPTANQPRPHRLFLQRSFTTGIRQPVELNYDMTVAGITKPDGTFADTLDNIDLQTHSIYPNNRVLVWASGDVPAATTYINQDTQVRVFPAVTVALTGYRAFSTTY